jgi:cytochrome c biogenesis protein CcdA
MGLMAFMEGMGTSSIPIIAALFIGLMTAISPCPLTTNITAIAYISKKIGDSKRTLRIGAVYALGRTLTYVVLASTIVWLGLNIQAIALPLQKYGNLLIGPLLFIIGIVMLELVKLDFIKGFSRIGALKEKLSDNGYIGSFLLGVIFALAFCPFSAVLFFGMLIPLALKAGSGIIIPAVFGLATGLPVIIFSFILVHSVTKLAKLMNKIKVVEKWIRNAVGVVFIAAGIYYSVSVFLW